VYGTRNAQVTDMLAGFRPDYTSPFCWLRRYETLASAALKNFLLIGAPVTVVVHMEACQWTDLETAIVGVKKVF
jgi:hypothetical protein